MKTKTVPTIKAMITARRMTLNSRAIWSADGEDGGLGPVGAPSGSDCDMTGSGLCRLGGRHVVEFPLTAQERRFPAHQLTPIPPEKYTEMTVRNAC